jgi:hypothetical protein
MSEWSFTKRLIVGLILLALVGAGMAVIGRVNKPLENTCTKRVLPLEVTPSTAVAQNIVKDWENKHALDAAKKGTYIDFPFIVVYAITFWFFSVWAGLALSPYDPRWLAYGRAFGVAGIVAGALDFFVENPGLLLEMNGMYNPWITAIKAIGAWIKWVLVLLLLVFLVSSLIMWLRIRWHKEEPDSRKMMPAA